MLRLDLGPNSSFGISTTERNRKETTLRPVRSEKSHINFQTPQANQAPRLIKCFSCLLS